MEKANMFLNELNCDFFNPNWENDQNDPFESALSSMVSSPTASSNGNGENNNSVQLRELIGRLGTICSNSPHNPYTSVNSTNNSCYTTPLNSPPKLNLSVMENNQQIRGLNLQIHGTHFPPFSTDPGFEERAAKFSSFANNGSLVGLNHSVKIPGSQENAEIADSRDNSSLTEQIPGGEIGLKSRKRKSIPRGKDKEIPASTPAKDANVESENSELTAKKSKSEDGSENENDGAKSNEDSNNKKQTKNSSKAQEPPKDYIHVRARRGQATDAHSLAERVRREKISERMKFLQDLVPGCNKVTGKAVMLDEIINYVQSLQRQVEFLSMKLSTIDSRMELSMEALASKEKFQSQGHLPHHMYPSDGYPFQSQPNLQMANGTEETFATNHFNAALGRNQLPHVDNFSQTASQASAFWEDDLRSFVQMGYNQNETQNFHGILPTAQMKVEL